MANQDIQTTLYNGTHTILFENTTHTYHVDGTQRASVTNIMSKVLAKPELMLWPLNMALQFLQAKIPKITELDLEAARHEHERRRNLGSNVGTIVHGLVEEFLKSGNVDLSNHPVAVRNATNGFIAWYHTHGPKAITIEQPIYSRTFKYVGTYDFILEIEGRNYLCDLKTSNRSQKAPAGIYADHFIQLGGYLAAYDEQRTYEQQEGTKLITIDDLMIISCKKDGIVDTLTASQLNLSLNDCINLWHATHTLYSTLTKIKTRLLGEEI